MEPARFLLYKKNKSSRLKTQGCDYILLFTPTIIVVIAS